LFIGCNTNKLNDSKVGGEVYVMPKNFGDAAAPAGTTRICDNSMLLGFELDVSKIITSSAGLGRVDLI
jgi:hypothetical protein